ncbi:MAG: hypothetical protein ACI4R5_08610 [Acetatifactor sp.]
MVNVQELVYRALKGIHNNVTDSWPQGWKERETVVYTEEENKSHERAGKKTTKSYCRYRIDILSKKSTSSLVQEIDRVLGYNEEDGTGLGMTRTFCQDDNEGEYRHKIMRYECIVGEGDGRIYGIN